MYFVRINMHENSHSLLFVDVVVDTNFFVRIA
jgi:hypothetical protein